ncbi:MAG: hypothetical protein ACX939_13725 [Hyphococcus sp.]
MAIVSPPADIAGRDIRIGPKTAETVTYVVIAVLAIAIAVPAAIATSDMKLFEECTAGCAQK